MKQLSIISLALCALMIGFCGSITAGEPGSTTPADLAKSSVDGATPTAANTNHGYSVRYTPANTLDNNYQCKEMIVTITASGTTGVTGTFSGTLTEAKTGREVPVTNGKFDIPYPAYSKK